ISQRREQTLALVEAQGAQGHARLAGKFADGKAVAGRERFPRLLVATSRSLDTAIGSSAVFVSHVAPTYYLSRLARTLACSARERWHWGVLPRKYYCRAGPLGVVPRGHRTSQKRRR